MKWRACATVAALLSLLAGCDGRDRERLSPTQPFAAAALAATGTPTPKPGAALANWIADAVTVSSTGPGCGWGRGVGDRRSGVYWRIARDGDAIVLEEDMENWATDHVTFTGAAHGVRFAAAAELPGAPICDFRGGEISGSFSEDGLTFDAVATYVWGPEENQGRTEKRWTGIRLEGR